MARWAAVLVLFFPSLILWSVLNIREAPTIFAVVLVVFFFVRFQVAPRARDLLFAQDVPSAADEDGVAGADALVLVPPVPREDPSLFQELSELGDELRALRSEE